MHDEQGNPKDALYQKSLDIQLKVFGSEHLDVAKTKVRLKLSFRVMLFANMMVLVQGNISNILKAQGKLPEALTMLHDVLAIFEKTLGQDHPVVADTKVCYLNTWGHGHGVDAASLWAGEHGACL